MLRKSVLAAAFAVSLRAADAFASGGHPNFQFSLDGIPPGSIVLMCSEIRALNETDRLGVDAVAFMESHRDALPAEYFDSYLQAVKDAREGKATTIIGYEISAADVLDKAVPALLGSIEMHVCDQAEVLGIGR